MKMYHIRVLNSNTQAMGIGLPREVATFFQGVFFTIERSGTGIVLSSGAVPDVSSERLEKYNYEDCEIPTNTTGATIINL